VIYLIIYYINQSRNQTRSSSTTAIESCYRRRWCLYLVRLFSKQSIL